MAAVSSGSLLSKLISGLEKSRFTLLVTTGDLNCPQLLRAFFRKEATLLLLERDQQRYLPGPTHVCDLFGSLDGLETYESYQNKIRDRLLAGKGDKNINHNLYIDSLNFLLADKRYLASVYQLLYDLIDKYEMVVATVNSKLLDDVARSELDRLATTIVDVDVDSKCLHAQVIHKKRNKRIGFTIARSEERFTIDLSGKLNPVAVQASALPTSTTDEPNLDELTFNLGLKENEVKARDQVKLPYVKQNESKVLYYPDKNDDIDEDEDPDDDLDF